MVKYRCFFFCVELGEWGEGEWERGGIWEWEEREGEEDWVGFWVGVE